MSLYKHIKHPHMSLNANMVHRSEQTGLNTRVALVLTKGVGSMWTAYLFTVLSIVGLLGLLGLLNPFTFLLCTWVSQMFLQLVFLPILSVGQNVLGRKAEIQAEEAFKTTQNTYHDIEQVMAHLSAQDDRIEAMEANILEALRVTKTITKPRQLKT
jgi:hypothetical protein